MFKVETIFLTRKCSLKCPHCMIWKTHRREIPPSEWAKIMNAHYNTITEFIVILGGEPLEYWRPFEGLLELVKQIHEVDYAISSNSITLTFDRAKKLVEAGLKNWTVSIDYPRTLARMYAAKDPRAYAGWRALEWFKRLGVPDLHATITLYPGNVHYFPQIVRDLMEMEVWVEPTFAMWAKSPWYDSFPSSVKPKWKPEHLDYIWEGIELLKNYKYFHGMPKMFENGGLLEMLHATFKCEKLHVPTIDEDGYMRLCRDIHGKRVRKWHALDIINDLDKFISDWMEDYKELCKGCNWDCAWHVKHKFEKFRHI